MTHPLAGVYCAQLNPSFEPGKFTALATVEGGSGNRTYISDYAGGCGNGTVQVNIWNASNSLVDAEFVLLVP
ncbi:MAG: hypothetical protein JSS97_06015 [Actinobacteria bacterium]|nr:hypothetical protein [Actinomycetota bacterium]